MNTINNEEPAASNFRIHSSAAVLNTAPNIALSLPLRSAFTTASQRGQYIVGKKRSCSGRRAGGRAGGHCIVIATHIPRSLDYM